MQQLPLAREVGRLMFGYAAVFAEYDDYPRHERRAALAAHILKGSTWIKKSASSRKRDPIEVFRRLTPALVPVGKAQGPLSRVKTGLGNNRLINRSISVLRLVLTAAQLAHAQFEHTAAHYFLIGVIQSS